MRTAGATVGVIACGALATDIGEIVARREWPIDVHPLPPLLHNHPERIAPEVERTLGEVSERYERVAIAYADCGTYGALDEVCERYGIAGCRVRTATASTREPSSTARCWSRSRVPIC